MEKRLGAMSRAELIVEMERRGLAVPAGAKKIQLIDLISSDVAKKKAAEAAPKAIQAQAIVPAVAPKPVVVVKTAIVPKAKAVPKKAVPKPAVAPKLPVKKYRLLAEARLSVGTLAAGSIVELSAGDAKALISQGAAEAVED